MRLQNMSAHRQMRQRVLKKYILITQYNPIIIYLFDLNKYGKSIFKHFPSYDISAADDFEHILSKKKEICITEWITYD